MLQLPELGQQRELALALQGGPDLLDARGHLRIRAQSLVELLQLRMKDIGVVSVNVTMSAWTDSRECDDERVDR